MKKQRNLGKSDANRWEREERRRRRICVHASSVRVNRKEKSGASALIRGEEPVRRVVIGRLRLVVASDLLEAVAPPLVYAGPRVRGRRASSLKTASFVAFTRPHRDRGEVRLDRTNRESRVGRGYQLKHNERALLHQETEHGHGSRFDEPRTL